MLLGEKEKLASFCLDYIWLLKILQLQGWPKKFEPLGLPTETCQSPGGTEEFIQRQSCVLDLLPVFQQSNLSYFFLFSIPPQFY